MIAGPHSSACSMKPTSPDRRFDIICVHAFSRFYRNGAEMELTIRKLRKHGVEVVSVTQPTGDDPSQEMMRQMIGIFDEYTSRENGKNVTRAMRESAKQGFWNGTTPPLGYRIVAAERRGSKVKKRLEIDPVEAELVRLIFRLYAEGDGRSGPLGVKETTKWLNEHGYRTRRGSTFGVGPLHRILKSSYYATGKWPYGRRNSRTGGLHDPATIVEIEIPPIIPLELVGKGPRTTCPQQSKGDAATGRERPDAPHRARYLRFLRRRHDPNRHSPAQPVLQLLQLCRLSPERKVRLPGPACLDGQARRPRHRKRQGTFVHAGTPHHDP